LMRRLAQDSRLVSFPVIAYGSVHDYSSKNRA
jgi:hypothetical protein